IQKLEAQLGVQLLERGKQQNSLTEAGRLFYEQSLQIVKDMELLQNSLADLQSGGAGNVRIGVTDPTASYRLPKLLQKFMARFPRIELSVEIAGTAALCEQLLRGELDMILCSAPQLGTELHFEPLFIEEFVLLLPGDHALAGETEITADRLRGHRLLITAAGCPYRKKLESVLQESAGPPLNTMEIGSMTSLKFYVESGIGMAFVPGIMLQPLPADIAYYYPADTLLDKGLKDIGHAMQELEKVRNNFVWNDFDSVGDVEQTRIEALTVSTKDREQNGSRYIPVELPRLPFADACFDLTLSAHFLFMYSDRLDYDFHLQTLMELMRVTTDEIRIFPLVDLSCKRYEQLDRLILEISSQGWNAEELQVPYEFQKGANSMLRITRI
ncbi:hypothetical protein KC345_g11383, partial [Hortaea werneckii]